MYIIGSNRVINSWRVGLSRSRDGLQGARFEIQGFEWSVA